MAIISFSSLADRPWDYSLLPFSNTNTAGIITSFSLLEFGLVTTAITRMQGLASACVLVSFRRSPSRNLCNGTSAGDQITTSRRVDIVGEGSAVSCMKLKARIFGNCITLSSVYVMVEDDEMAPLLDPDCRH